MMLLTALGYAIAFVLLTIVTVFMVAKIESKITFKEILDGFKRRWEAFIASFSFYFFSKTLLINKNDLILRKKVKTMCNTIKVCI